MARPVYKYQPNNENPDSAIGISIPFNNGGIGRDVSMNYNSASLAGNSVFSQTYTTEDQVVSNLKNLLLTRKGDRYMQPNFGTNIYNMLFENNVEDIRSSLKKTLTKDIKYWLPYISVNDIKLTTSDDMHALTVTINFEVTNIGSNLVINITATENELQVSNARPNSSLQLIRY